MVITKIIETSRWRIMKLNKKHESFIMEYIYNGNNGAKAYLSVYPNSSEESARANASRLLTNDNVLTKLRELQDEHFKKKMLSAIHKRKILDDIIMDSESSNNDKIKAIDLSNKMDGTYNELNKPIEIKSDWFKWTIEK